jgi:hypothetical protein
MTGILDVLLDLPLLPSDAGLQNSASKRLWLAMARNRALIYVGIGQYAEMST